MPSSDKTNMCVHNTFKIILLLMDGKSSSLCDPNNNGLPISLFLLTPQFLPYDAWHLHVTQKNYDFWQYCTIMIY